MSPTALGAKRKASHEKSHPYIDIMEASIGANAATDIPKNYRSKVKYIIPFRLLFW